MFGDGRKKKRMRYFAASSSAALEIGKQYLRSLNSTSTSEPLQI
jgi:hypothetical protein